MMRNSRRLYYRSVLAGCGLLLAGCGSLFGQVNLYVPNQNNIPPNISEYSINTTTGALTPVSGQGTTTTDDNPTRVVMTPNNKFLYISNGNGYVDAYMVAPGGVLTAIQAGPPPSHGYPVPNPLGIFATNTNVYVTSSGSPNQVVIFSINQSTGALTQLTCSACTTGAGSQPQNIVVDPSGSFAYVALYGTHQIGVGTIGGNGAFTAFTAAYTGPTAFTPEDLALNGSGLFATTFLGPLLGGSNTVYAFNVSGATVTPATIPTYTTGIGATSNPNGITTSGNFLYVADQGSGTVTAFSMSGSALTPIGTPVASGGGTTGVSVDPTGHYLYASNQSAGTVTTFLIAGNGAISQVGSPLATGTAPYYLLAHLTPTATIPAASTWSLAVLGMLLAGMAGLLYRKAYR